MNRCVIALGEVLWDLLPAGPVLGGAPANFACHARALGAEALLISRVGADLRGEEIVRRLAEKGIPAALIQRDPERATGTVAVEISPDGQPRYTIAEDAAWDAIEATDAARRAVENAAAVCFGTLAQRAQVSRESIQRLVSLAPADAWRVLDINLRQHFHSRGVIEASLHLANALKLNDAELPVLAELFSLTGGEREQLGALAHTVGLRAIAFTRGARGSALWREGEWSDHPGVRCEVRDTIGAGDSFTAAFVLGLLAGRPLDAINRHANDVAAVVCSREGATPPLPDALRLALP